MSQNVVVPGVTQPRHPLDADPPVGTYVVGTTATAQRSHATMITSKGGRAGDEWFTMRAAPCGFVATARLGDLLFDPDATHHGWARTCQKCAAAVRAEQAA